MPSERVLTGLRKNGDLRTKKGKKLFAERLAARKMVMIPVATAISEVNILHTQYAIIDI